MTAGVRQPGMGEWGGLPAGFDPDFDDTAWTDDWLRVPIALPPPSSHPGGYRLERRLLADFEVFGRRYHLPVPFDCRILLDPNGCLWMSNTPQEHIMMYNNARLTRGRVLVGGLGLGLYPQYAEAVGGATRIMVVEQSEVVADLVAPTVRAALSAPVEVILGDVQAVLESPPADLYDTVFLDTWATLDAAILPSVNQLRGLAARHLAPGGRTLLWGYRWMVRLFEEACREVLSLPPGEREALLADRERVPAAAAALLQPVARRFAGVEIADLRAALEWCRAYAVRL